MKNWAQEMELDENMDKYEIERFLVLIGNAGIPSIEEYAENIGSSRDDIADEYCREYGDVIRKCRDKATE